MFSNLISDNPNYMAGLAGILGILQDFTAGKFHFWYFFSDMKQIDSHLKA